MGCAGRPNLWDTHRHSRCAVAEVPGCAYSQCPVDICLILDVTGSMADELPDVVAALTTSLDELACLGGSDYRVALVTVDDTPTGDYTLQVPFAYGNAQLVRDIIANWVIVPGTGGDLPEPTDLALEAVLKNDFAGAWRDSATTNLYCYVITDAFASGDDDITSAEDQLRAINSAASGQSNKGINTSVLLATADTAIGSFWQLVAAAGGGTLTQPFDASPLETAINQHCGNFTSTSSTDQCCGKVLCDLCGTITIGYDTWTGPLSWDGEAYTGTIGGYSIRMLWRRNQDEYGNITCGDGDRCLFVVEIDGEEVYEFARCPGEYSSRDQVKCLSPRGTAEWTDGYDEVTLEFEPASDSDSQNVEVTNETGECESYCLSRKCVPKRLCGAYLRRDPDEIECSYRESYCEADVTLIYDECAREWTGLVECPDKDVDVVVAITRVYDECVLVATIDGMESEPCEEFDVAGTDVQCTFEVVDPYTGEVTTLSVGPLRCGLCEDNSEECPCCPKTYDAHTTSFEIFGRMTIPYDAAASDCGFSTDSGADAVYEHTETWSCIGVIGDAGNTITFTNLVSGSGSLGTGIRVTLACIEENGQNRWYLAYEGTCARDDTWVEVTPDGEICPTCDGSQMQSEFTFSGAICCEISGDPDPIQLSQAFSVYLRITAECC